MFGDSRRKLRAWYQAEDPSQAEEVCMDDSNPKTFNAMPTPTLVEAGRAVYRLLLRSCFSTHLTTMMLPTGSPMGPFLTLLAIVGGWRQIWRAACRQVDAFRA